MATNLNLPPLDADCCDGGRMLGSKNLVPEEPLFLQAHRKFFIHDLPIESGKTFTGGELVGIVAGVITKLTTAPTAADNLAITQYSLDTTPASLAVGKGQVRATVIGACGGLNEKAVILPPAVVFNDNLRGILAAKNIYTLN